MQPKTVFANPAFNSQKKLIMSDAGKTRVVLPADVDILLGRGKPFQNHPGNQRMLGLVDKYRDRYQEAERKEKHDIVEEVMGIICGSGGRFLRRVDYENYWVEVNHSIAYRKVGHAFRSKARKADSSSKVAPPMTRQRIEAPPANKTASMEEMLIADLRMRRAAMHQAELMNMSNLAQFSGSSALDRLLMPGAAMGLGPGLYNGLGAAGFVGAGGLMSPENLFRQQSIRQQNLLAANSAFLGNGIMNPNDPSSLGVTSSAQSKAGVPGSQHPQVFPSGFVPGTKEHSECRGLAVVDHKF